MKEDKGRREKGWEEGRKEGGERKIGKQREHLNGHHSGQQNLETGLCK